ncbi:MAG: hypothetical protein ACREAC_30190, partial [Blastocatellia bacterium]
RHKATRFGSGLDLPFAVYLHLASRIVGLVWCWYRNGYLEGSGNKSRTTLETAALKTVAFGSSLADRFQPAQPPAPPAPVLCGLEFQRLPLRWWIVRLHFQ